MSPTSEKLEKPSLWLSRDLIHMEKTYNSNHHMWNQSFELSFHSFDSSRQSKAGIHGPKSWAGPDTDQGFFLNSRLGGPWISGLRQFLGWWWRTGSWRNPSSFGSNKSIDPPRIGVMWIFDVISLNFCVHSAAHTITTKIISWSIKESSTYLNLLELLIHSSVWSPWLFGLLLGFIIPILLMVPIANSSVEPWLQQ